ncbi:uncharacterized protein LOC114523246 [Dendronephthya gigantea]|uniref:uncharacterized protein LOC114523246 n=1 Tax=Dendronephthya gigantea TaxID=151771 RepID=UPI00106D5DD3|nr:uncharacterized protein LOC114523246 [Dendronephthya gigantea]
MASRHGNGHETNFSGTRDDMSRTITSILRRTRRLKFGEYPSVVNEEAKNLEKEIKELLKLNNDELQKKNGEIEVLKRRVFGLEEKVTELETEIIAVKMKAQCADTIDAGEAMKIMEYHVGKFVLPETEEIEIDAIRQILTHIQHDPVSYEKWQQLTEACIIDGAKQGNELWTKQHKNVVKTLIIYRNAAAHHKKFDFEQLLQMMVKAKSKHRSQCEDIVEMFKRVNYLMKLGIVASDFLKSEVRSRQCQKSSKELLVKCAELWARKKVLNLQDIKLTEAEEHAAYYLPDLVRRTWRNTIPFVLGVNIVRFRKMVEIKTAEVLREVPLIFVENRRCQTLFELLRFSRCAKWRKGRELEGNQWKKSTADIRWEESHDNAMKEMTRLGRDDHRRYIDPLPLVVAKLHVADFIENNELWEASSEILKILSWKENEM